MALRRFDGVDDFVVVRQPTALARGACTFAALVRPTTTRQVVICTSIAAGVGFRRYGLLANTNGSLGLVVDGADGGTSPAGWLVTNRWRLVAVTVPAGSPMTARLHSYDFDTRTWSRSNASSMPAAALTADGVGIGCFGAFSGLLFAGDIAAVGMWAQDLGDTNVGRLVTDAWLTVGPPAGLVTLDQRGPSDPIFDRVSSEVTTTVSGGAFLDDFPPIAVIPPTVKRKVSGVWVDRELKRRAAGTWQKPAAIEVAR